mgnify:CR=1
GFGEFFITLVCEKKVVFKVARFVFLCWRCGRCVVGEFWR